MDEPHAPRALPLPEGFLPPDCAFSGQDWTALARQWFPVARVDAVAAKPRQVSLLGLRLAIYRLPDGICIGRDLCPHRGLPLSAGRIEGDELVCAYHGLRFGADGQCRKVPEKLAPKGTECFSLTMFPAVERHGLAWTCLIPGAEPAIPEVLPAMEAVAQDDGAAPSIERLALNEYRRLFDAM
ncbi:Rieske 2Fe-2S domain-containing protein [Variovorax boronicumulans]|uniref:Rieske 2Fe-2S domain-containing protein n=1 Tax=Variovorax boronicumulans TaxID=436515 RepID=UPI0033993242